MSIGARLKEARKRMKLKQEDFAGRCGIVLKTQSRFERDEFVPSGEYLLALAALGIDAGYVLTGRPSARNDEETALLHAFRSASPEVKAATLRMLGGVSAVPVISSTIHGDVGNVNHGDQTFQQPVTFNVGTKKR